jgi:hypothetical protein
MPEEYFTSEVNEIKILKKAGESDSVVGIYILEQTLPMIEKVLNAEIDSYDFFNNPEDFEAFLREINKRYIKEFSMQMGYFDFDNPTQKIIIASINIDREHFIFVMNEDLEMNILRYDNNYKPYIDFDNNPIRISDDLQIFIIEEHNSGGTCSGASSQEYFSYISNLRFVSALSTEANGIHEDEKPANYDYTTSCSYRSDFSSVNYYIDIDGDDTKEIIITRFKAPFEGDEDIIKEFWRFMGNDIYKWNSEERIFKEVGDAEEFLYGATEFTDNNNFPTFEFWTEAYCPDSTKEPQYNFQVPTGYNLTKCTEGEKGSHSGCITCVMSEIILEKDVLDISNRAIRNGKYSEMTSWHFQEVNLENCTGEEYKELVSYPQQIVKVEDKENYDYFSYGEGAAGSFYRTNVFVFQKADHCYAFDVVLRTSNCGNYDNKEKCETVQEQEIDNYFKSIDNAINYFLENFKN